MYDSTETTKPDPSPPSGTIVINNGAISTTSRDVVLTTTVTDPTGNVSGVSFSNDNVHWTDRPWNTYWQLEAGDGLKTVYARFRDTFGNVSPVVSDTIDLNTTNTNYGLTINNGALFTNQVTVTLNIGATPATEQIQVSNDGGFAGAVWEPYNATKPWQLTQYGVSAIPRTVYVRYPARTDGTFVTVQDDIILDVTPPTGSARVMSGSLADARSSQVVLELSATDDASGVGGVQIGNRPDLNDAAWQPFQPRVSWSTESARVYVRFRDNAGNLSPIYAAATSSLPQVFLPFVAR
jgi:hypothetical protein